MDTSRNFLEVLYLKMLLFCKKIFQMAVLRDLKKDINTFLGDYYLKRVFSGSFWNSSKTQRGQCVNR